MLLKGKISQCLTGGASYSGGVLKWEAEEEVTVTKLSANITR